MAISAFHLGIVRGELKLLAQEISLVPDSDREEDANEIDGVYANPGKAAADSDDLGFGHGNSSAEEESMRGTTYVTAEEKKISPETCDGLSIPFDIGHIYKAKPGGFFSYLWRISTGISSRLLLCPTISI